MMTPRVTSFSCVLLLTLACAVSASAASSPVQLGIETTVENNRPRVRLTTPDQFAPGAVVESTDALASPTLWEIVEPLRGASASADWEDPRDPGVERFYRVRAPEPEISRVEPAFVTGAGGEVVYLVGQCFTDTDTVEVNGQILPVTFINDRLVSITLPALPQGRLQLTLHSSSGRTFVFPHILETRGSQRRLEPPTDPVAHPRASQTSKTTVRGWDYQTKRPILGEVQVDVGGFIVPGRGFDFVWSLHYRSLSTETSALGPRWDFSYNVKLRQLANGNVEVCDGSGVARELNLQADGSFSGDELFVSVADLDGDGRPDLLFADHGQWIFHPFDGTARAGLLVESRDRFGNRMLFNYDDQGNLQTIVDTLDREYTLAYNPVGQLESVTDFTGRQMVFSYYQAGEADGSPGDLKTIRSPIVTGTPNGNDFPEGKTLTFRYTSGQSAEPLNHLLTELVDAKGRSARRWTYGMISDFGMSRCTSEERGITINTTHVEYRQVTPSPDNGFATLRAIVNDQVGNVQEWFIDSLNRPVILREFTGRADAASPTTETVNRPANKLRQTDPDFFETRWEWTRDSLIRRITYPRGNGLEMTYSRDLDPFDSPLTKGNPLSLRQNNPLYTESGAGNNPLFESKQSVMLFSHLPGYGSPGELEFASLIVDPNGKATRIRHNSVAQMIERTSPNGATHQFAWNTSGQLITHTNPPNSEGHSRVDTFHYYEDPLDPQFGYLHQEIVDDELIGARLTTTFEYDATGRVIRQIDPRGNDELFLWNALDQLVESQSAMLPNAKGESFRTTRWFAYDKNNNPVSETTEDRDDNGTLSPDTALVTRYEFDTRDRLTATVQEQAGTVCVREETDYDGEDRVVETRSGEATNGNDPNARTTLVYDERGNLFQQVRAPGSPLQSTDQFDYDANGNLRRQIQGIEDTTEPRVTRFGYDGFDRLNARTNAMGNVTYWNRDPAGNVIAEWVFGELSDTSNSTAKNVRLAESRFRYDDLQQLVRRDDAFFDPATQAPFGDGWRTTSWIYTPDSQLLSETDDNLRSTSYAYDSVNRLASITDARGNVRSFTYDENGNLLSDTSTEVSDLNLADKRFTVTMTYDALNRLTASADGVGNTTSFAYDSRGLLVGQTDPVGALTRMTYDCADRLTRTDFYEDVSRAVLLNSTASTYDANHRLTSVTDGNRNLTRHNYDSLDRLKATTFADATVRSWIHDVHDNVIEETQATGTEVQFRYDRLNRLTGKTILPGVDVATTTTAESYIHDGQDRLIQAANDAATVNLTYDSLGNARTEQRGTFVASSTFDAVGNRTSLTYPGGGVAVYEVDAINRPTQFAFAPAGQSSIPVNFRQYEGPDRLVKVALGNGLNTRYMHSGAYGVLNPTGDQGFRTVNFIRHAAPGNTRNIFDLTLTHDGAMNRTGLGLSGGVVPGGAVLSTALGYDKMHRLTRGRKGIELLELSSTTFELDAVGNRISVTGGVHPGTYTMDKTTPEPADAQVHQYSTTPVGEQTYDRNGNVRDHRNSIANMTMRHDYRDQLVSVTDNATGTALMEYAYDAFGRRITKSQPDAAGGDPIVHEFAYAGSRLIEDHSPDGTVKQFLYAGIGGVDDDCNGTDHENLRKPGPGDGVDDDCDGFVDDLVGFVQAGSVIYYHADDLGTVFAVSDDEGNAIEYYDYDEFGRVTISSPDASPRGASIVGNDRFFHGWELDAETGLYHVGPVRWMAPESLSSRTYSSRQGRFLSRSIPENGRGAADNFFQFAGGNPWSPFGGAGSPLGTLSRALAKEEGGRHTPFHNKRTGMAPLGNHPNVVTFVGAVRSGSSGLSHLHKEGVIHRDLAARSRTIGDVDGDGCPDVAVMFNPREYPATRGSARAFNQNTSRSNRSGLRAQDHNSSRSNKSGTRAFNQNTSRSNRSGLRAQDHNSSRSNKTSSVFDAGAGSTSLLRSPHDALKSTINIVRRTGGGRHEVAMNSIRNIKAIYGGGGGGGGSGLAVFGFEPQVLSSTTR